MQATTTSNTQAAAFEMLMNAIGSLLGPVVQQLLSSDPELVKLKGWHGMTALHRACLIGDYNIILMLVQANSDVNAMTDFGETPLLYACKRGVPSVVHLLIQCGAQVDVKDKRGRGVLHHAAENGAVYVMKYFEDCFSADFKEPDGNQQSPMHIACTHGQLELFKFLMAKGRSNLRQTDSEGNLCIHITAKHGFGHMTWSQLCVLGLPVLKQRNGKGYTPCDLAAQSDDFGHRELKPVLQYYSKQPESTKVGGPVYTWYFWLLLPFFYYLALVLFAEQMDRNQILIIFGGLALFGYRVRNVSHRLHDVSRWPTPFYAAFFGSGVFHTIICFYWKMLPHFYSHPLIIVLSLFTVTVLLYVYFKIMTQDPGKRNMSAKDPASGKPLTLVDLCAVQQPKYQYCSFCDMISPNNDTKHCKLCEACFHRMDHHCLFILQCVAGNNHTLFLWFLIVSFINMVLFSLAFFLYIYTLYSQLEWTGILLQLFHLQAWPLSILFLNIGSAFWAGGLLQFQYDLVSAGCTTFFDGGIMDRRSLPRDVRMKNFFYFLMGWPLPYKNPLSPLERDSTSVQIL